MCKWVGVILLDVTTCLYVKMQGHIIICIYGVVSYSLGGWWITILAVSMRLYQAIYEDWVYEDTCKDGSSQCVT